MTPKEIEKLGCTKLANEEMKKLNKVAIECDNLATRSKHIKNTLKKSVSDGEKNENSPNVINLPKNEKNIVSNVNVNPEKKNTGFGICNRPECCGKEMQLEKMSNETLQEKRIRITKAVEKAQEEQRLKAAQDASSKPNLKSTQTASDAQKLKVEHTAEPVKTINIVATSPKSKKLVQIDITNPVSFQINSNKAMKISIGGNAKPISKPKSKPKKKKSKSKPKPKTLPWDAEMSARDILKETIDGKYTILE